MKHSPDRKFLHKKNNSPNVKQLQKFQVFCYIFFFWGTARLRPPESKNYTEDCGRERLGRYSWGRKPTARGRRPVWQMQADKHSGTAAMFHQLFLNSVPHKSTQFCLEILPAFSWCGYNYSLSELGQEEQAAQAGTQWLKRKETKGFMWMKWNSGIHSNSRVSLCYLMALNDVDFFSYSVGQLKNKTIYP